MAEMRKSLCCQDAVLVRERHEVGDRGEARKNEKRSAELGPGIEPAGRGLGDKRRCEEEGDSGAAKVVASWSRGHARIHKSVRRREARRPGDGGL